MFTVSADSLASEALQENYWAFISHVEEDLPWCDWLYFTLHGYPVPPALAVQATKFGFPLPDALSAFPDPNDSTHADHLSKALDRARYLIVVISPHSAHAGQIDQHIRAFKRAGGEERIIAVVVEGQPDSTLCKRSEKRDWLPLWLQWRLGADGQFLPADLTEPIVIDARPGHSNLDEVMTTLISILLDVPRPEYELLESLGPDSGEIARASVFAARAQLMEAAMRDSSEALLSCDQAEPEPVVIRDRKNARIGATLLIGALGIVSAIGGAMFLRNCDFSGRSLAKVNAAVPVVTAATSTGETEALRIRAEAQIIRAELLRDSGDANGAADAFFAAIQSEYELERMTGEAAQSLKIARLCRSRGVLLESLNRNADALVSFERARANLRDMRGDDVDQRGIESLRNAVDESIKRLTPVSAESR